MVQVLWSLALLLSFSSAQASFVSFLAESKWKFVDDTDPVLQTPACRAFTDTSDSAEKIEFFLSYPKSKEILPMIGLRTKLAPPLISVRITDNKFETLFLLKEGANNDEPNLYWYAPVGFAGLEEIIKVRNFLDLVLDPQGPSPKAVKVSLAGSANAINSIKTCLKTTPFPGDFFKLLNAQKDNLTPDLGDRTAATLFSTTQDAFAAYLAGQKINADITALRKTVAPILEKEKTALAALKTAQTNFTNAKAKLETAQSQVANLEKTIADGKAQLAQYQQEKPAAEADLARKKSAYTPLKAQMAPYEQRSAQAANSVQSLKTEITRNETLITRNRKRIPELESERDSLQRQIPGLERRVRELANEYDDADRAYRNYDVQREKREQLENDTWYRWAKRDREDGLRELDRARTSTRDAERKLTDAHRALSSCRARPDANCSTEENNVRSAERERDRARLDEHSAESKIRNAEDKMRRIEDDIERKVNDESDKLRRARDDADSAYSSKRRELNNAQDRLSEVRSAIPVLRDQIAKAESALPVLRAQLAEAEAAYAQRIREQADFATQIGYDVAEREYIAAAARLDGIVKGIATLTKNIPTWEKDLINVRKTIGPLTAAYQKAQTELTAAEQKLVPIQEQLKPFRAQEAVLLAELSKQSDRFKLDRAAYQDLIVELKNRR